VSSVESAIACSSPRVGIGLEADVITRIRRRHWTAVHLLLLGTAAVLVASSVSSVVRGRLARERVVRGVAAPAKAPGPAAAPLSEYLEIARRGLFAEIPANETAISGGTVQPGPASLRLLGTGGDVENPYAVVEDTKERRQDVVRLGDSLAGAEVVAIGWRRIILRRGAEEEMLIVPADLGIVPAAATATRAVAAPAAAGPSDGAIKELGEDRFLVARAEVEHQLQNLSQVFTQMRAVPNLKEGKTDGFRVFAIRRDSIFDRIGLENNDVVQRINGVELTDPARAMGLLQELQGESRLTVDVLRGGAPRTLSYEIR
jgi:general secretion pathway protein C